MCDYLGTHSTRSESTTSCPTSIEGSPVSQRRAFGRDSALGNSPIAENSSSEGRPETSTPRFSRFRTNTLTEEDDPGSSRSSPVRASSLRSIKRTPSSASFRSQGATVTDFGPIAVESVNILELAMSNVPKLAFILRTHWEEAKIIRTHRFRLRRHTSCFSAMEAVDWLVSVGGAASREDAVRVMKCMQLQSCIQSIVKDGIFADDLSLFYFQSAIRRRSIQHNDSVISMDSILSESDSRLNVTSLSRSSDTFSPLGVPDWCPLHVLLDSTISDMDSVFYRSVAILFGRWFREELKSTRIIRNRRSGIDTSLYANCFCGKDAVSMLLRYSVMVASREQAVSLIQVLYDYHVIHSVADDYLFKDSSALYRFRMDNPKHQLVSDVTGKSIDAFAASSEHVVCFYEVQEDMARVISSLLSKSYRRNSDALAADLSYPEEDFVKVMLDTSQCSSKKEVEKIVARLLHCGLIGRCNSFIPVSARQSGSGSELFFQFPDNGSDEEHQTNNSMCVGEVGRIALKLYHRWLDSYDSEDQDSGSDQFRALDFVKWIVTSASSPLSHIEALCIARLLLRWEFLSAIDCKTVLFANDSLYRWNVEAVKAVLTMNASSSQPVPRTNSGSSVASTSSVGATGCPLPNKSRTASTDVDSPSSSKMSLVDSVNFLKSLSRFTSSSGSVTAVPFDEVAIYAKLLCTRWQREKVVKDRRYKLKLYKSCFIGKEAVDWLIKEGCAVNRRDALTIMRHFDRHGLVCHVCNDHQFRDEMLFFRFQLDGMNNSSSSLGSHVGIGRMSSSFEQGDKKSASQKTSIASFSEETSGLSETSFAALLSGESVSVSDMAVLCDVLRLQWRGSRLIHTVRHSLHVYQHGFVACEAVTWMVEQGHASHRGEAVKIMQALEELDLIHHVLDKHSFADSSIVFRFRRDDPAGSLPVNYKIGDDHLDLYQRLCHHSSPVLKDRQYHGRTFLSCVTGTHLVDYLVRNHEHFINQRPEAVAFCRDLHSRRIIQHVCGQHGFKDTGLFYFFTEDPQWESGPLMTHSKLNRNSFASTAHEKSGRSDSYGREGRKAPLLRHTRTWESAAQGGSFDTIASSHEETGRITPLARSSRAHTTSGVRLERRSRSSESTSLAALSAFNRSHTINEFSRRTPPSPTRRRSSDTSIPPPLPSGSPTGLPPIRSKIMTQGKSDLYSSSPLVPIESMDSIDILKSSFESGYLRPVDIQQLLKEEVLFSDEEDSESDSGDEDNEPAAATASN